jgi:hypothetical protein
MTILTTEQINFMNTLVDICQTLHTDWSLKQKVDYVVGNMND